MCSDCDWLLRLSGEAAKAEGPLLDVIKMCKAEGWEMIADDTRIDLATCQRQTQQTVKSVLCFGYSNVIV